MAGIACEICDGNLEMGVGGLAICSDCGMKYTREHVKEMVRQSRAAEPAISTDQIAANFLELAQHALDSQNLPEAENYANKLIELDPSNYQAWLIKGAAAGWQSTLNDIRLLEAANCLSRAIECAPEEEEVGVRRHASDLMGDLAVAVINLRAKIYVEYPSPDQAEGFQRDLDLILQASRSLLDRSGTTVGRIWEKIAITINNAVVKAWSDTIQKDYRAQRYPGEFEFDQFRDRIPPAIKLIETAIGLSSQDDMEDIVRYENVILFAESLRDAKSYRYTVDGYVVNSTLTDKAKANNNAKIAHSKETIARIKRSREEEKRSKERAAADERRDAYWSHSRNRAEKKRLEAEKVELQQQLGELRGQEETIPGQPELLEARTRLKSLNAQLEGTGMFKRAERKALQAQIMEAEKLRDERQRAISEAQSQLKARIQEVESRLAAVINELTKPR